MGALKLLSACAKSGMNHPIQGLPGSGVDVAIVGAGAAGIAAARRLHADGLRPLMIEASDRIGGRASTSSVGLGVPLDRGCAWFHNASRNPLREHADRLGFRYGRNATMRFHVHGRLFEMDETRAVNAAWFEALERLSATGRAGRDVSAASQLDPEAQYAAIRDYLLCAINGVSPQHYATAEAAAEVDSHEDWPCLDGLGRLVERLAAGLAVARNCAVRHVVHGHDGVRIVTEAGTLRAGAAIVTVATGVLRQGSITFDPPMPGDQRDALAAVPMGRAEKIALRFGCDPIGLAPNTYLTIKRGSDTMGFHMLAGDALLAVGHAGGETAEAIAREPEQAVIEWALGFLEHAFGSDVRACYRAATRTCWIDDPGFCGSYSAAVPGGGHAAREVIARPLTERVRFAGEASDPVAFATVHGAWASGERAARELSTILGAQPP